MLLHQCKSKRSQCINIMVSGMRRAQDTDTTHCLLSHFLAARGLVIRFWPMRGKKSDYCRSLRGSATEQRWCVCVCVYSFTLLHLYPRGKRQNGKRQPIRNGEAAELILDCHFWTSCVRKLLFSYFFKW